MSEIDRLTPEQRKVVHEFGWGIVKTLRECGVVSPKQQIMIINKVLDDLSSAYRELAFENRRRPKLTRTIS